LKNRRLAVLGNADSSIAYHEVQGHAAGIPGCNRYRHGYLPGVSELNCIGDQVGNYLAQPASISPKKEGHILPNLGAEPQAPLAGRHLKCAKQAAHQLFQIE
jgi:hypothetical protein